MKPMPIVDITNVPMKTEISIQPMPAVKAQTSAAIEPPTMRLNAM